MTVYLNEFYKAFVTGRRIMVVGAAQEGLAPQGDLQVFINCHWKKENGPVDIVYSACPSNPEKVLKGNPKFVWLDSGQPNYRLWKRACTLNRVPFASYHRKYSRFGYENCIGDHWVGVWQRRYQFIPLSGILAIKHLTLYPVESIFVTGMDFYSIDGIVPDWRGPFDLKKQMQAFRDLAEEDSRIALDSTLQKILYNQKD